MEPNIKNRTFFCRDNLSVLQGINSNSIDLIYLDPPFNANKLDDKNISVGDKESSFANHLSGDLAKEEWSDDNKEKYSAAFRLLNTIKQIEGSKSYNHFYLSYMAIRIIECHRILNEEGSLYLHCSPVMSHYLKVLLDYVFDESNFMNEIIWNYNRRSLIKKRFVSSHDVIFLYRKSKGFSIQNIVETSEKPIFIKDIDKYNYEPREKMLTDVWNIAPMTTNNQEFTGYPTQKPLKLLERIIKASSKEGEVVLDPFCGCATTCIAAEKNNRRWIGIDISKQAYEVIKQRIRKELNNERDYNIIIREDKPLRTDGI